LLLNSGEYSVFQFKLLIIEINNFINCWGKKTNFFVNKSPEEYKSYIKYAKIRATFEHIDNNLFLVYNITVTKQKAQGYLQKWKQVCEEFI
jgi:hypothetical protein